MHLKPDMGGEVHAAVIVGSDCQAMAGAWLKFAGAMSSLSLISIGQWFCR
jgi:hypothetical protein